MDAAVEGLVDYREAAVLDPAWWRRFRMLTQALERKKRGQAHDAGYRFHLAQVANGSLTAESFGRAQDQSIEAYHDVVGAVRPWEGGGYREKKRAEFKDNRQAYIDNFGVDPADPRYKAWEAEQLRRLDAGEFDAAEADQDVMLTKRLQDRIIAGG